MMPSPLPHWSWADDVRLDRGYRAFLAQQGCPTESSAAEPRPREADRLLGHDWAWATPADVHAG